MKNLLKILINFTQWIKYNKIINFKEIKNKKLKHSNVKRQIVQIMKITIQYIIIKVHLTLILP